MRFLLTVFVLISPSLALSCWGLIIANDDQVSILGTRTAADHPRTHRDCGFKGNSDIYGIGIRIGYYTQTLSTWFANYFVLSEAKSLRPTNLLFFLAVFVGLIWLSHQSPNTFAIEAFLLLQLLFATWYTGILNRGRFSKKYWRFSPMRSVISSVTMMAVLGYNAWFWWSGLDRMERTPCGSFAFFMAKVELFSWYRSAYRALAVPAVVSGAFIQVWQSVELIQYLMAGSSDEAKYYRSLAESLQKEAGVIDPMSGKIGDSTPSTTAQSSQVILQSCHPPNLHRTTPGEPLTDSAGQSPDRSALPVLRTNSDAFAIAVETPLPESPSITEPTTNTSPSGANLEDPGTAPNTSLNEILETERFVKHILDVSVKQHSTWHYDLRIPLLKTPLRLFIWSVHSPKTIHRRWQAAFAQRPLQFSILVPLFQHINSLHRYPFYSYVLMLEKAMLSPLYKYTSPRAIETVLKFDTVQLPDDRPFWTFFFQALFSFSMCWLDAFD